MDDYDEDDLLLMDAISEYVDNLPDNQREAFKEKIAADLQFKQEIAQAIMETSTLIAAAAMLIEEDQFQEEADRLMKSMADSEHAYRLRIYFLTRVDDPSIQALVSTPDQKDRFDKRITNILVKYKAKKSKPKAKPKKAVKAIPKPKKKTVRALPKPKKKVVKAVAKPKKKVVKAPPKPKKKAKK